MSSLVDMRLLSESALGFGFSCIWTMLGSRQLCRKNSVEIMVDDDAIEHFLQVGSC